MGATVADIITKVRELSGTEKTKQVTNATLGRWINEGIKNLYDRIIEADESYYSSRALLSFGTANDGSLTGDALAATAKLPDDFYHMRGVKRFPNTSREVPVFPVAESDSSRKVGYILRGKDIQVTPYRYASAGPFEVRYAPKPPQFGRVLDLSVAAGDGIVTGPYTEPALQARNGNFTKADVARRLYLYNCANSVDNRGPTYGTDGGIVLLSRPSDTPDLIDLNNAIESFTNEEFTYETVAMINHSAGTGAISTDAVELDEFLTNYIHFVECFAAAKVLDKKKQSTAGMFTQMTAEIERITDSAPDRESEPEAAPVLWRPRGLHGGGWDAGY